MANLFIKRDAVMRKKTESKDASVESVVDHVEELEFADIASAKIDDSAEEATGKSLKKKGRAQPYNIDNERKYKRIWRQNKKENTETADLAKEVKKKTKSKIKKKKKVEFVGYQLVDEIHSEYRGLDKQEAFDKLRVEAQELWDKLAPTFPSNLKLNEAKSIVAIKLLKKYRKKYTSINLFANVVNMSCHLLRYYLLHPERNQEQKERREVILKISKEFPDYGKRRITQELNKRGYFYSVVTVSRDMDLLGIKHDSPKVKKQKARKEAREAKARQKAAKKQLVKTEVKD